VIKTRLRILHDFFFVAGRPLLTSDCTRVYLLCRALWRRRLETFSPLRRYLILRESPYLRGFRRPFRRWVFPPSAITASYQKKQIALSCNIPFRLLRVRSCASFGARWRHLTARGIPPPPAIRLLRNGSFLLCNSARRSFFFFVGRLRGRRKWDALLSQTFLPIRVVLRFELLQSWFWAGLPSGPIGGYPPKKISTHPPLFPF